MGVLFFESKIGFIKITEDDGFITEIKLVNDVGKSIEVNENLIQAQNEIEEYLKKERKVFDLPIKLKGTDFQKKVWNELLKIPYGETDSYFDIAKNINKEKALRAVGTAIGKNPLLIVVPCHRVINKNGNLGGFACGLEVKKKLLKTENII
ncbi:MAG: methylated-DNA--[protein]-cysteine S-methyltransferase [Ruminococcaceae bacterium]|nr:methylated-DNA--[protein]-cysteine S-methyltransferase [Oscillospiraceae bacterium]